MPIIKKILHPILLSFLVLSTTAIAQKKESVLWKISGKELTSPSYLYGTFHTVSIKLLDSFPELKQIISNSEFGIFEKSDNDIGQVEGVDIPTPPLNTLFTPEEYTLVDSFFTQSSYGSIRPHNDDASISGMLQAVIMLNQEQTKNQDRFYDEYIQSYMLDSMHRKTFGLDEPVEMAESAKKTDYKAAAKLLVYLIQTKVDANTLINEPTLDENLYTTTMQADMRLSEDVKNKWILDGTIKRNQIWLPKIIRKGKEGTCFIAVGLAHLQYKTGLIALLRAKGYKLEPVSLHKM